MNDFRAIILAAGQGTRMKSSVPKILHPVAGKLIIQHVLDVVKSLRSLKTYLVLGHQNHVVRKHLTKDIQVVIQDKLLGTADAVRRTQSFMRGFRGHILIVCGDTPLLEKNVLRRLMERHQKTKAVCTVLTAAVDTPTGYGRIIRDAQGTIRAIREEKDASFDERTIKEINSGVYCFRCTELFATINKIKVNPKKKEFYLTDIVELLLEQKMLVETLVTDDWSVALGVNTREDLALAGKILRERILKNLMSQGVTIVDPNTTFVDTDVMIGRDTVIHPFTVINSGVKIGRECSIGPFARLRPGTTIGNKVEVGNFGEISRSKIGDGTFMKHFGFLGDAVVGSKVNIGAGVVTANFDGREKHSTVIGDQAFIGSDAILVAPANIGANAVVGAGSVLAKGKTVPKNSLAVGVPARIIRRGKK